MTLARNLGATLGRRHRNRLAAGVQPRRDQSVTARLLISGPTSPILVPRTEAPDRDVQPFRYLTREPPNGVER